MTVVFPNYSEANMALTSKLVRASWGVALLGMLLASTAARADAVTDWNGAACTILSGAHLNAARADRVLAFMHTAMYQAARASGTQAGVDLDAALAASGRATLLALAPSEQTAIEAAYQSALAKDTADPAARAAGIAAGEAAAAAVLAARGDDGASLEMAYQPGGKAPGEYVPTMQEIAPVLVHWGRRKPWLMASADAFRPAPPPALSSAAWARDLQEMRDFGGRNSTRRSPAETATARFWAANSPLIFFNLARGVAQMPERSVLRNARLYAALAQAIDDTTIAVFDAKYHYRFWRPVTAVGRDDPAWVPLLDTPPHPEYPCAHCAVASVVATVLQAELGRASPPLLETSSPSAAGERRQWRSPAAFSQEVALTRIHGGVHFRSSTEAGTALGQRVGALAASSFRLGRD